MIICLYNDRVPFYTDDCDASPIFSSFKIVFKKNLKEDIGNECIITCDGTDFQVYEHGRIILVIKIRSQDFETKFV